MLKCCSLLSLKYTANQYVDEKGGSEVEAEQRSGIFACLTTVCPP